jgi:predicted acylesterase/phospholipase RssA
MGFMQYDLVFEGGGAKGVVFVGAMQELLRRGHSTGRLLGTSAGAIMATFTAAGFSIEEMLAALQEKDAQGVPVFQKFMGRPRPFTAEEIANSASRRALERIDLPFIPNFLENRLDMLLLQLMRYPDLSHVFSFLERGGWYSADEFLKWVCAKLDQPAPDGSERNLSRLNFAEMHRQTGRDLSLVAADTTEHRLLVLNHRTTPKLPVVWGMRMSISMPFFWQEVIWQPEWGAYLNHSLVGHRVVDGGLLSNFPIELFLSTDPHVVALMGPKTSQAVLGLLIDESLAVEGVDTPPKVPPPIDFEEFLTVQRIIGLVDTAMQAHDKMVIEAFEQFVCRLPARGYRTTEFDMTDTRREKLIAAGRAAMEYYFRTQETEGMKGPDVDEMERAFKRADRIARRILQ